jgi:hypothetical protein
VGSFGSCFVSWFFHVVMNVGLELGRMEMMEGGRVLVPMYVSVVAES